MIVGASNPRAQLAYAFRPISNFLCQTFSSLRQVYARIPFALGKLRCKVLRDLLISDFRLPVPSLNDNSDRCLRQGVACEFHHKIPWLVVRSYVFYMSTNRLCPGLQRSGDFLFVLRSLCWSTVASLGQHLISYYGDRESIYFICEGLDG